MEVKRRTVINWFRKIYNDIQPFLEKQQIVAESSPTLVDEIKEAQQQWQEARDYFNMVSEPELVDHAAYKIEAARVKYMYLLNKAKKNDLKIFDILELDE